MDVATDRLQPRPTGASMGSAAIAVAALGLFAWQAGRYFPNADGRLGSDYKYFLPLLVAGDFWFQQNGIGHLPYFTPAFCGGIVLLANPQSVIFSVPQVLTAVGGPVRAIFFTLVLFASLGALGTYALLVRCFRASHQAAVLGGVLFLFNGVLIYRLAIGHLTYHAYGLVPLLALVTLSSHRSLRQGEWRLSRDLLTPIVLGGMVIGYVTYGGALNLQIPFVLTVLCLLSLVQMRSGFDLVPWMVLAGSGAWGALLSAVKLVPATVLAGQFVRAYIPMHLFRDPVEELRLLLEGFFVPSLLPDHVDFWGGGRLARHEFEFSLSLVPLALVVMFALRHVRDARPWPRLRATPITALTLAAVLVLPLMLTFGGWQWGRLLLQIPVINNNTTFVRWWSIYLLPVIVVASLAFDRLAATPRRRMALLVCCSCLAIAQDIGMSSPYYARADNTYDPQAVLAAFTSVRGGGAPRPIEGIASTVLPSGSAISRTEHINDAFVTGGSSWPCYEPLFGYALEIAPKLGIRTGPIEAAGDGGFLNLVDPSLYVIGGERTSWRFPAARLEEARRFAAYQSYDWDEPRWQRAAGFVSVFAVASTLLYFSGLAGLAIRRRAQAHGPRAARRH